MSDKIYSDEVKMCYLQPNQIISQKNGLIRIRDQRASGDIGDDHFSNDKITNKITTPCNIHNSIISNNISENFQQCMEFSSTEIGADSDQYCELNENVVLKKDSEINLVNKIHSASVKFDIIASTSEKYEKCNLSLQHSECKEGIVIAEAILPENVNVSQKDFSDEQNKHSLTRSIPKENDADLKSSTFNEINTAKLLPPQLNVCENHSSLKEEQEFVKDYQSKSELSGFKESMVSVKVDEESPCLQRELTSCTYNNESYYNSKIPSPQLNSTFNTISNGLNINTAESNMYNNKFSTCSDMSNFVDKMYDSDRNTTCMEFTNKTNLIINYLPPYMSQDEVKALFVSIGEVESCKLVREKATGESLGYAFVKFVFPVDAEKAIQILNGLRLQNKTIKVSLARPSSESIKGANLYICGLPKKMTQAELEKLFSQYGKIITARILYDNKTGISRGVAFIRFDQRHDAEAAIHFLNGYQPQSDLRDSSLLEPITVKFANSPNSVRHDNLNFALLKQAAQIKSATSNAAPPYIATTAAKAVAAAGLLSPLQQIASLSERFKYNSVLGSGTSNSFASAADYLPAMVSAATAVNPLWAPAVFASSGALSSSGWSIFVYNLAPETEEADLWQLFGPFGAVQTVKIIRDPLTSKCKGFGFVTMSNYEESLLAIHSLNGFTLGKRVLQVSFKTSPNTKDLCLTQCPTSSSLYQPILMEQAFQNTEIVSPQANKEHANYGKQLSIDESYLTPNMPRAKSSAFSVKRYNLSPSICKSINPQVNLKFQQMIQDQTANLANRKKRINENYQQFGNHLIQPSKECLNFPVKENVALRFLAEKHAKLQNKAKVDTSESLN